MDVGMVLRFGTDEAERRRLQQVLLCVDGDFREKTPVCLKWNTQYDDSLDPARYRGAERRRDKRWRIPYVAGVREDLADKILDLVTSRIEHYYKTGDTLCCELEDEQKFIDIDELVRSEHYS